MKDFFFTYLNNRSGGSNLIELMIAGALAIISYISLSTMFKMDHENVTRLEASFISQVTAESVTNLISSINRSDLFDEIKFGNIKLDFFMSSNSTPVNLSWLQSWENSDPRIQKINIKIKIFDKDGITENSDCLSTLENFSRCHMQVETEVKFNYQKDGEEHVKRWKKWITGTEFPIY